MPEKHSLVFIATLTFYCELLHRQLFSPQKTAMKLDFHSA